MSKIQQMDNLILSPIQRDELATEIANEVIEGIKSLLDIQNQSLPEDNYISRKDTAQLLNISLVTLSNWTKKSLLKSYKIGSRVLYKKSEVIESLRGVEQFRGN